MIYTPCTLWSISLPFIPLFCAFCIENLSSLSAVSLRFSHFIAFRSMGLHCYVAVGDYLRNTVIDSTLLELQCLNTTLLSPLFATSPPSTLSPSPTVSRPPTLFATSPHHLLTPPTADAHPSAKRHGTQTQWLKKGEWAVYVELATPSASSMRRLSRRRRTPVPGRAAGCWGPRRV